MTYENKVLFGSLILYANVTRETDQILGISTTSQRYSSALSYFLAYIQRGINTHRLSQLMKSIYTSDPTSFHIVASNFIQSSSPDTTTTPRAMDAQHNEENQATKTPGNTFPSQQKRWSRRLDLVHERVILERAIQQANKASLWVSLNQLLSNLGAYFIDNIVLL